MKKIILFCSVLLVTTCLNAQWQQTNGVFGGGGNVLFSFGNKIFLGTYHNNNASNNLIFESDDNGNTWTKKLSGVPAGVTNITNINSKLYCSYTYYSTDSGGVYSSSDSGNTWIKLPTPPVFALQKVIAHNTDLFAFSYTGSGLHKSSDGGITWTMVNHPNTGNFPTELRFIGSTMFISFTNSNSVYTSVNNGGSWTLTAGTNLPASGTMNSFLTIGTDLYCVIAGNATYKSINNGSSWSTVSAITSADKLFYSGGYLVYTSNGGTSLFYSTDMGASFTNDYINHPVKDVLFSNGELLMAAFEIACQKIDQFGSDIVCNTGIVATGIPVLFGNKTSKLQTYIRYVGAYQTTDRGQNWNAISGMAQNFEYVYENGNYVYGSDSYLFNYHFSKDGGNTYTYAPHGGLSGAHLYDICGSNDSVYIATSNGLYSSTDTGVTVTLLYNGFNSTYVNSVKINGNKLYACTNQNVYASSDHGVNWSVMNTGLPGTLYRQKLHVFNNTLYLFLCNVSYTNSFIFRYNEITSSWVNISTGLPTTNNYFYALIQRQNQLILGTLKGVFLTVNNGQSWNDIGQGLTDKTIYSLYADTVNLYAGTNCAGVWKRSLNDPIFVPDVSFVNDAVNDTLCTGQTVNFVAGGAAQYQFFINGVSQGAAGTNNLFSSSSLTDNDTVSVVGYGFAGGTDTVYNVMHVLNQSPPIVSLQSDNNNTLVCPNTPFNFTANGGTDYEFFVSGISQGLSSNNILSWTSAGSFSIYAVGYDANNCRSVSNQFSYQVYNGAPPAQPSICMVTVDTNSTHNIIYWDKSGFTYIDSFRVYREDVTNIYTNIGAVAFNDLSEYHDFAANPNVTTKRYKISAVDSCGTESLLSNYHNTIYIINNGLGQFSWNPLYTIENGSNPVNNYVLMRDNVSNGNWTQVASTAGTQNSIVDTAYATYQSTASWRVETVWNISCTPSYKNNPGTMSTVTKSRSNIKNNLVAGISTGTFSQKDFVMAPNPAQDLIEIICSPEIKKVSIDIYDVMGRKVVTEKAGKTEHSIKINTTLLPGGIYSVYLVYEGGRIIKKLLIEK